MAKSGPIPHTHAFAQALYRHIEIVAGKDWSDDSDALCDFMSELTDAALEQPRHLNTNLVFEEAVDEEKINFVAGVIAGHQIPTLGDLEVFATAILGNTRSGLGREMIEQGRDYIRVLQEERELARLRAESPPIEDEVLFDEPPPSAALSPTTTVGSDTAPAEVHSDTSPPEKGKRGWTAQQQGG